MNYPVLKVTLLALLASVVLHAAIGWVTVGGSERVLLGVDAGHGGAVGMAARQVLQAEVQINTPQTPTATQARDFQDDALQVPDPDADMTPTVPLAKKDFSPSDLPPTVIAQHNPAPPTVRPTMPPPTTPPSVGSAGSPTAKTPASGDGGAMTSTEPVLLSNPPPVYPTTARLKGQEGRVLLTVTVSEKGTVSDVKIKKSSGHDALDEAVLAAVKKWKFKPATKYGKPVEDTRDLPVVFSLKK